MAACSSVSLPLIGSSGQVVAEMQIALLPGILAAGPSPLLQVPVDVESDRSIPSVQLLEGAEYRFVLRGDIAPGVLVEPREVFQPDTEDGLTGRVRPGLFTGALKVLLRQSTQTLGEAQVEVRSRKLNYLSEYRWMLSDIAEQMTELVMDRFSASNATFVADETRDAVTLYQRFAFLKSLVSGPVFLTAINQILRRPHVIWEEQVSCVVPGHPMRGGVRLCRALARPGPREAWSTGALISLPRKIETQRTEATHDTTPNRFVRFALEHWLQVIGDIEVRLKAEGTTVFAVQRGLTEVAQLGEQLQEILQQDLFRDLGPLDRFPADDQVLHKRDGYRDLFRAYTEFDLASKLSWSGGEDVYGAGQRDVAALYEYWVFVQLAKTVSSLVGVSFDLGGLIEARANGLNVYLKSGREVVLSGMVTRLGRQLKVELCFNRRFGRAPISGGLAGSWSMAMQPDYSLNICPADEELARAESVLVHFDAKYRVSALTELFGLTEGEPSERAGLQFARKGAIRDDLLKMHAYRDAIQRSAGAYVIYPGDDEGQQYLEFHELLPGLGAFSLRPTEHGDAAGIVALNRFISDILDHVATRLTAHERSRHYLSELYDKPEQLPSPSESWYVQRLPDDASVMLGWVKSQSHWDWICRHRSYNVRAVGRKGGQTVDARLLFSQLVLLYGPGMSAPILARVISDPKLITEDGMAATSYPHPKGDYMCLGIQRIDPRDWLDGIDSAMLTELAFSRSRIKGAPVVLPWAEIAACSSGS
jgi:predicted component of viral defense system (DUF524 family)